MLQRVSASVTAYLPCIRNAGVMFFGLVVIGSIRGRLPQFKQELFQRTLFRDHGASRSLYYLSRLMTCIQREKQMDSLKGTVAFSGEFGQ
mmetsp:Transcript_29776/g.67440  ORF Transcript_29776/g.67440 Transcript_29776/m.67440 type:complete len:90 (+) Transcript_29776:400-669(+)